MSASPPIPSDIARIAAPLLFGVLWNWCLYGVLVVQLYVYSYNFLDDKKLLKLLVYTIFLVETLQTALSGADVYYWFVSGYGDITHLTSPYATPFDVPIIEAVVSSSVQFFFAFRIWLLGMKKSWCLSLIICLSSTIGSVAAFTGGILAHIHRDFPNTDILKIPAMIWLAGNLMADIHIAAAMLYHLARRRKDRDDLFSNHALDHYLSRIVRLTVETNVMTATVGIVSFLLIVIFPHETWLTCPTAILGKLYSNTFLVSLNNRISIREAAATKEVVVISPNVAFAPSRSKDSSETMVMRPPAAYNVRSLMDSKGHERAVIVNGETYPYG